jgi:hypothetical protein
MRSIRHALARLAIARTVRFDTTPDLVTLLPA